VTLPIVRQEYPAQIRMPFEDNAEEVKRFALVPVCRPPYTGDSRHARVVFVQQDFQTDSMVLGGRKQMVVDFKTRFLFDPSISAAKVRQEIKLRFGAGFERGAHVNYVQRWNDGGNFTKRLDNFGYPMLVLALQRRHQMGRRRFGI